jgi:hypothetical protein
MRNCALGPDDVVAGRRRSLRALVPRHCELFPIPPPASPCERWGRDERSSLWGRRERSGRRGGGSLHAFRTRLFRSTSPHPSHRSQRSRCATPERASLVSSPRFADARGEDKKRRDASDSDSTVKEPFSFNTVIASAAKQSISPRQERWIASSQALLAMTST